MSISVTCSCGKRFKAKDEWAGKRCRCPGCQQPVTVPAAAALPDEPGSGGINSDDLLSSALQDAERADTGPVRSADAGESRGPGRQTCPHCGAKVKAGAALCLQCGYNHATGKVLAAASRDSAAQDDDDAPSQSRPMANLLSPRNIKIAVVVLIVLIVGGLLISSMLSTARMNRIIADAGNGSPTEAITDAATIRDAEAMLPRIVNLCRESFKDTSKDGIARVNALYRIVKSLSDKADVSSVWKAAGEHSNIRIALIEHMAAARSLDWLIQQAEKGDEKQRQIVTEALQRKLPLGNVPGNDIKALPGAGGGPAAIRQAVAKQCAAALAGKFVADFNVVNRSEAAIRRGGIYEIEPAESIDRVTFTRPILTIAVEGENWTVEWFAQRWQGTLEQVRQMRLECTLDQTGDELRNYPLLRGHGEKKLVLTLAGDGPAVDASDVVTNVPDKLWSETYPKNAPPPADPAKAQHKLDEIIGLDSKNTSGTPKYVTTVWYLQRGKPGIARVGVQLRAAE